MTVGPGITPGLLTSETEFRTARGLQG